MMIKIHHHLRTTETKEIIVEKNLTLLLKIKCRTPQTKI